MSTFCSPDTASGALQRRWRLPISSSGQRDVANASGGIDRIFTLTEGASSASATVLNWRAADGSGVNLLDYVGQIQPWTDQPWSQAAAPVLIA
jgi:hypothetical protein